MIRLLRSWLLLAPLLGLSSPQTDSSLSGRVSQLGGEVYAWPDSYDGPQESGGRRVIFTSDIFSSRSVVFSFLAHFKSQNPIWFQIWRPTFDNAYQLIFNYQFTPSEDQLETRAVIQLVENECFLAQPNDRLAFAQDDTLGSLGYKIEPNRELGFTQFHTLADGESLPTVGDSIDVDLLELPYVFALAALVDEDVAFYDTNGIQCRAGLVVPPIPTTPSPTTPDLIGPPGPAGETGEIGPKGDTGDIGATGALGESGPQGEEGPMGPNGLEGSIGATGSIGPQGDMGDSGLPGDIGGRGGIGATGGMGPEGPTGPTGDVGASASGSTGNNNKECECDSGLLQPYLILGLIIWLVILTLVVLILLVIVTIRHKEYTRSREQTKNWDTLREEKWREYTMSHDRMSDQSRH